MFTEMDANLTPNEDQLVTDLASDYSERMVTGERVSMHDYLDKLPECRHSRSLHDSGE